MAQSDGNVQNSARGHGTECIECIYTKGLISQSFPFCSISFQSYYHQTIQYPQSPDLIPGLVTTIWTEISQQNHHPLLSQVPAHSNFFWSSAVGLWNQPKRLYSGKPIMCGISKSCAYLSIWHIKGNHLPNLELPVKWACAILVSNVVVKICRQWIRNICC